MNNEVHNLRLILSGTHNPCDEVNLGINHFIKKYMMEPGYMEMNYKTGQKIFKAATDNLDVLLTDFPDEKDVIGGSYRGYDIYLDDCLLDNEIIFRSSKCGN